MKMSKSLGIIVLAVLLAMFTKPASAAESTTVAPNYSIATLTPGTTTTNLTVTVAGGLSGTVFNFGMVNAPAGVTPSFVPTSVTTSGSSTLTLSIANSTAAGVYLLNVQTNGINAGAAFVLVIGDKWTGAGGDQNWSNGNNWSLGTAPSGTTGALFDNNAAATSTAVNNVIDSSVTISNLIYLNTNATTAYYHNTQVANGQTLTLNNLWVGNDIAGGSPPSIEFGSGGITVASISGAGGKVSIPTGQVFVGGGSGSFSGAHFAQLDMSGLDNFAISNPVTAIKVGIENPKSSSGTLFLAKTNVIIAGDNGYDPVKLDSGPGGGIIIGHNQFDRTSGGHVTNAIYMGISNAIYVNYFTIGRGDAVDIFAFNPAFVGGGATPTAYIRGTHGDYVGVYAVDDGSPNGTFNCTVTNDFTGGIVDLAATNLIVARGRDQGVQTSNNVGTLTFNAGTILAQNLTLGYLFPAGTNSVVTGMVNVNGSGVLNVPGSVMLTSRPITSPAGSAPPPVGILNVNGGTVLANIITNGGIQNGTAMIGLSSGGTIVATNGIGAVGPVISNISITNSTLRLFLSGSVVPVKCTSFTAVGTSTIGFDAISGVTLPATNHIINYGAFFGSIANLALGTLPNGYSGYLTNNTGNSSIDLVLTSSAPSVPHFNTISISGGNLTFAGTNGTPNGTFYVLSSTNVALPLSSWTPISTNNFDANGNYNVVLPITTSLVKQFYALKQ